jgi:hypothetical protein
MTKKSLRILLPIFLLSLLPATSSTAYADAVSMSSLSFSNLTITQSAGTLALTIVQTTTSAQAMNSLGQNDQDPPSSGGTVTQNTASVTFADSSASINNVNLSGSVNSNVNLPNCTCSASSTAQGSMTGSFRIINGTGNVTVTFSTMLTRLQIAVTNQSGFAVSKVHFSLNVNGEVVPFDSTLTVGAGNNFRVSDTQAITKAVMLQFDTDYKFSLELSASSEAQSEVPEPTTMVLLVSGLGGMAGFVKKRRTGV